MNKRYTYQDKVMEVTNIEEGEEQYADEGVYRKMSAHYPENYKSYDEYNDLVKGYWNKKNPRPKPFKSKLRKEDIKIEYYE